MDEPAAIATLEKRNFAGRRARKATTRRKLVDVAIELIRKQGYAQLSVDEIASRAGTNRTTFYLHFRNKADLVADIAEQVRGDAQSALEKLDLDGLTLESVAAWIDAVEVIYRKHSKLIDAMQTALAADWQSAEIFDRIAGSYLLGLTLQVEEGKRSALQSRLMAAFLLVERYMFYHALRGYSLGGAALRDDLPRIVLDILRTERPSGVMARDCTS